MLADTIACYARLRHPDREVVFCTGTDEHGMKIQRAAEDKGVEPAPFCDDVSQTFRVSEKCPKLRFLFGT